MKCSVLCYPYFSELRSIRIRTQTIGHSSPNVSLLILNRNQHSLTPRLSLSLSDPEQKIHKPHGTASSSVQYLLSTYFFLVWYPLLSLAVLLSLSFFCLSACHKFVTFYCAFWFHKLVLSIFVELGIGKVLWNLEELFAYSFSYATANNTPPPKKSVE